MCDQGCCEVLCIDIRGRADADLACIFGLGQILIGLGRVGDIGFVIEQNPCALREREPLVAVILKIRRNAGF